MDKVSERMNKIERQATVNLNVLDKQMAILAERFDALEEKLDEVLKILECLPERYVTNDKFRPYAVALNMAGGATLLAVIGGLIKLVIIQ